VLRKPQVDPLLENFRELKAQGAAHKTGTALDRSPGFFGTEGVVLVLTRGLIALVF
jgi:hypothetical protein